MMQKKLSEEMKKRRKNTVLALDLLNNIKVIVSKEEFDNNRDRYAGVTKGYSTVRNTKGEILKIKKEDFDKNKYVGHTKGYISVKDSDGRTFSVKNDDPRWLSGELSGVTKNSTQSESSNEKRREWSLNHPMTCGKIMVTCENCHKKMNIGNYKRWHSNNKCITRNKI